MTATYTERNKRIFDVCLLLGTNVVLKSEQNQIISLLWSLRGGQNVSASRYLLDTVWNMPQRQARKSASLLIQRRRSFKETQV